MRRRLLSYGLVVLVTLIFAQFYNPLAAVQSLAQGGCQTFPETGKTVCAPFLGYWQQHGGLAQQGYPLTNAFAEVSDTDGKTYTVQYFERAVFEAHPENQPPNDVLLSLLGAFRLKQKYPNGDPSGGQSAPPTQPPAQGGRIIGQTLQVTDYSGKNTFNLQVIDAKEATTIPATGVWQAATATGKFVAVKFKATNLGNDSGTVPSIGLKDSKGRTFDTSSDINAELDAAEYYGGQPLGTAIQPSFTITLVFLYDVAPDATGYLLAP